MIRALVLSTLFVGACATSALAEEWPFKDPQDVATFTTSSVISGKEPILYVTHDDDDGAWQFHSGEPLTDAQPKVVSLSEIVKPRQLGQRVGRPSAWMGSEPKEQGRQVGTIGSAP